MSVNHAPQPVTMTIDLQNKKKEEKLKKNYKIAGKKADVAADVCLTNVLQALR